MLLSNLSIDGNQENIIATLTEAILPKTNTPGASDMSAHLFVLTMVDDCFKKEDQQKFLQGLKQFSAFSEKEFQKPFTQLTKVQKEQLLKKIEDKNVVSEEAASFYRTTRRLTLQCFLTSEYYLTQVQGYKQAPGPVFKGCVPVKNA